METCTPEERRLEISYTLENPRHSYSVCPPHEIGELAQYIHNLNGSAESDISTNATPINPEFISDSSTDKAESSVNPLPELPAFIREATHSRADDSLNVEEVAEALDCLLILG